MKPRKFLLRILNVYPQEWWIVRQLYLFQFFQGAGLAFFFTSAFALFLEKYPITELPVVMIFSSFLLWIAGFAYTKLEHHLSFNSFNRILLIFISGSIFASAICSFIATGDWYLYMLLAWFNILYLLNNLQFWGIATLFFDLRQSKRLFGVISAGDIPAKFVGYTLALIFVPYTGTRNLLFMSAACMLVSIPFFNRIIKSGKDEISKHITQHHKEQVSRKPISKLVENISTNIFIRRIAFISLIASSCIILINYGFYGEVRKAYQDDVTLAKFIAFFFATLRFIALITKMIFTGRLTASIGIKSALFITPAGMLLLVGTLAIAGLMSNDQKMIFYLFAISSIIVDVLRTSVNSPVLLTLMQPLNTFERLRAHNIVKGLMDPFASLFCGLFLYISFRWQQRVDLMLLCYVLIVLGVLWMIGVFLVNKQYLQMLVKTISSRYFSQEEFNLNDETVVKQIRKKLSTGNDEEVISILSMLTSKKNPVAEDLIAGLLGHSSRHIRLEALKLITGNYPGIVPHLKAMVMNENDSLVKSGLIRTICKICSNASDAEEYLKTGNEQDHKAAIAGMLDNPDVKISNIAEREINSLMLHSSAQNKQLVLGIFEEVKDRYGSTLHANLLNDPDPVIHQMAVKAVGKACRREVLTAMMPYLLTEEKKILNAFYSAGPSLVPLLREQIMLPALPDHLKEKLIILCGRIGGNEAKVLLVQLLTEMPGHASTVVKALHRCRYSADERTHKILEHIARMHIVYGVELLYMQKELQLDTDTYRALNSSLHYEIQDIREVLLCCFDCMYDREKINQAKFGLNTRRKESVANAMEIIELTVKKDIAKNFNLLFDTTDIQDKCTALRNLFTEKEFTRVENIISRILSERPVNYLSWTKACSLYFSKKFFHRLDKRIYEKYVASENRLLKETALFATATP